LDHGALGVQPRQGNELDLDGARPARAKEGAQEGRHQLGAQAIVVGPREHEPQVATPDVGGQHGVLEQHVAHARGRLHPELAPLERLEHARERLVEPAIFAQRLDELVRGRDVGVGVEAPEHVDAPAEQLGDELGREGRAEHLFEGP
jgi:hypothetical protein